MLLEFWKRVLELISFDGFKTLAYLQLIKTLKTKLWLWRLTQLMVGTWVDWQLSPRKSLFLKFCILTYKRTSRPLLGILFCRWQNLLWKTKAWIYSILSFMKIENCWRLKLLKFLQVLLTDNIFPYHFLFCSVLFQPTLWAV